jgi:hypothetical protein
MGHNFVNVGEGPTTPTLKISAVICAPSVVILDSSVVICDPSVVILDPPAVIFDLSIAILDASVLIFDPSVVILDPSVVILVSSVVTITPPPRLSSGYDGGSSYRGVNHDSTLTDIKWSHWLTEPQRTIP